MREIAGYLTKYSSKKFRLSEGKAGGLVMPRALETYVNGRKSPKAHTKTMH